QVPDEEIFINTYHDHRMAMGLAPLATLTNLKIESPEVVNKSYPGFWDDMRTVGFTISEG
ncbi:MAG: 3-phosphoshikimate 1-carboxyvinyltransferase, partial [Cyclobacteriaceae bacterium]|nr:3-phosphoshikimate 1-carboxyvinyltransferase [Cyclobacteriaceae bacterium]